MKKDKQWDTLIIPGAGDGPSPEACPLETASFCWAEVAGGRRGFAGIRRGKGVRVSEHAIKRMALRGINIVDALMSIEHGDSVEYGRNTLYRHNGICSVVGMHNQEHTLVTVFRERNNAY